MDYAMDMAGTVLTGEAAKAASNLMPSSPEDALHASLKSGMEQTCNTLSAAGGFGTGDMRIPLPPEIEPIMGKLQMLPGIGDQVEEFTESMNEAAEKAVGKAKTTFLKAVDKVSPKDMLDVIRGTERAGAELLERLSRTELTKLTEPVVQSVLGGSEKKLEKVLDAYHKIPLVPAISFSLLAYVLAKTLNAIFKLLGDREAASRASNPILSALTTRAPASLIKAGSQALISFQVVVNGSMGAATRTDLTIATDSVSFLKCAAPAAAATVCCRLLSAAVCCRVLHRFFFLHRPFLLRR